MQFTLRVDDIGLKSTGIIDLGLQLAQKFHSAMQGLPYLGAVIPAYVNEDGLQWLKSKPEGLMVALHGWNHESANGVRSEFHGMDLDECRARIDRGRALFGGEPRHMVLPFNAYEPELAEACYLEEMRYIWGGGSHDSQGPSSWPTPPQPYSIGRIAFVPSWAPTYAATLWRIGRDDQPLNGVLPGLLDLPGKCVLTLHITWEAAKCDDFRGVKWLVDLIAGRVISAEEYLS